MNNNFYTQSLPDVFAKLRTSKRGLSAEEAIRRLEEYGPNKLPEAKADSLAVIFLRQFQSPLIYILLAASAVVFIMGETVDGSIILAVLLFNAIVGTIQEGKAQNTLLALKRFTETQATALRDGKEIITSDIEIVPGDIIILQEGEKVPADARITLSQNLKVDEAALTGESEPVHKVADALDSGASVEEQRNMIFKGTHIVAGNGRAVVTGTALDTAIGKIAKEITAIESEIPLKANIRYLSRLIIAAVAAISTFLFLVGVFSGKTVVEMFATVVSLSVSIIPEGLPIVMTLVLASGVWRMSKRNALVKKLQAVEALGQARIIAVDKTGTITKNEMVIQRAYVDGKTFDIEGVGYEPKGEVFLNRAAVDAANHPELLFIAKLAAFSANARVMFSEERKEWRISGDPTEAALLVFSQKLGFHKDELIYESPIVAEIPFDYRLKYHATAYREDNRPFLSVIGAPEAILELSDKVWREGKELPLSKQEREELESIFLSLSREGLRVVAVAQRRMSSETLKPESVDGLVFVGFLGMKDALRPEAAGAVKNAASAGMRVVMITGDHKVTAEAIARDAGIFRDGDLILTGRDIDALTEKELSEKLGSVLVFARVTPEHKLRIIQAYKARGEIVAMTGDGVNDAPSLVAADLGVAMGKIGTEVAKEASDIVLLDDNFGSIISAVEEGRGIYKTIKKVILYLFSTSMGEVFAIAGALFMGIPLPLLPAQIIWLNFVTDGFLDVALAMEPKEKGLLSGSFERPKKYLIDKLMAYRMIIMAVPMAVGALYLFSRYYETDMAKAWTMALTVLAVFQWFNAWNCRSEDKSIFKTNPFSNKFLVGATFIIIVLQIFAVYHPVMQRILRTVPLALSEWLVIIAIAASIVIVEETRKFFYRR
ncbi:MAG: Cation-transporting P-type ATPase [Parcubacteria group bacterium GW2011_GWB1_52_7]|nr:MAG: Cation-transporting P-type ATPase [Parcubacteria group bacterium GW2011_GWA1_51_12]KKW28124.1 MAG: Cation-transporting P-type ATPase [Parcubacteria group bacterium GW2011_GWB1_52_7]